jgi:hypothetical protein
MRDQELQRRKILEQVRGQALHENGRAGIQKCARGMETFVAAPVSARRVRVQIDADEAVLADALLQFGDAGLLVDAG